MTEIRNTTILKSAGQVFNNAVCLLKALINVNWGGQNLTIVNFSVSNLHIFLSNNERRSVRLRRGATRYAHTSNFFSLYY